MRGGRKPHFKLSQRDPYVDAEAKATLDKSYAWSNRWMQGREWAAEARPWRAIFPLKGGEIRPD